MCLHTNRKEYRYVAYHFTCRIEIERLLKVKGSHVP